MTKPSTSSFGLSQEAIFTPLSQKQRATIVEAQSIVIWEQRVGPPETPCRSLLRTDCPDDFEILIWGSWSRFEFPHVGQNSNKTPSTRERVRTILEEAFHLLNAQPPHPSISKFAFSIWCPLNALDQTITRVFILQDSAANRLQSLPHTNQSSHVFRRGISRIRRNSPSQLDPILLRVQCLLLLVIRSWNK